CVEQNHGGSQTQKDDWFSENVCGENLPEKPGEVNDAEQGRHQAAARRDQCQRLQEHAYLRSEAKCLLLAKQRLRRRTIDLRNRRQHRIRERRRILTGAREWLFQLHLPWLSTPRSNG